MLVHHNGNDYATAAREASLDARARMERILAKGAREGLATIRQVHENRPSDRLVRGRALRWGYAAPSVLKPDMAKFIGDPELTGRTNDEGIPLQVAAILDAPQRPVVAMPQADEEIPRLILEVADGTHALHRHAFQQVATKAGVPADYLRRLTESDNPAMRALAQEILASHYGKTDLATDRHLIRDVGGEVRGFLSDKYRRLDSRPLLEAFLEAAKSVGAVPGGAMPGALRTSFKVYMPEIYEPIANEPILIGLEWHNSDFGAGAFSISLTVLRLWCSNRATIEDTIRKTHVGGRLSDDVAWSAKTVELDSAAMASVTHDIVRNNLLPEKVEDLVSAIKAVGEKQIGEKADPFGTRKFAELTKAELLKVREAFDSDDVINLPPGRTMWRASNAISWIAQQVEDEERKHALERVAGSLLKAA